MSTKTLKIRLGQTGMTLLEVMLALGLSGLVLLGVVEFYTSYTEKLTRMNESVENQTDIESGQQIMLRDLKSIDPSFGTLKLLDDEGRSFFEYYPDVPERDLDKDAVCGRPCRVYTMKPGAFSEITLVLHDPSAHPLPSFVYNPTWAYQLHACAPAPCRNTVRGAEPTFLGVNTSSEWISGANGRPAVYHGTPPVMEYPGYWHKWQLLMFDSPTAFRPDGTTASQWPHVPPRSPYFIGMVGSDAATAPFTFVGTVAPALRDLFNIDDPVNPATKVDTVDVFFRKLPPVGGGQPLVRVRPVRLVKYSIEVMFPAIDPALSPAEKKKRQGALRVWRQVFARGAWDARRHLVAEYVKTVQLRRSTVTDKTVTFVLSKDELKKGGEP
jgi:hypothetical protein